MRNPVAPLTLVLVLSSAACGGGGPSAPGGPPGPQGSAGPSASGKADAGLCASRHGQAPPAGAVSAGSGAGPALAAFGKGEITVDEAIRYTLSAISGETVPAAYRPSGAGGGAISAAMALLPWASPGTCDWLARFLPR
ncbi:hypothetical protein [Actinocorallia longicatena]|uniref:Collagen triple helix repeat protein n=1 Tax=Actinocorallia longicatena TaxID=111803 RepID=A0ABP6QAJ6_9ACTN